MKTKVSIDKNGATPQLGHAAKQTSLEAYGALFQGIDLCADELRKLPLAENRHGTLQVIRTALLRCLEATKVLIEAEEMPTGKAR